MILIAPFFLVLAIAFSWPCFFSIFRPQTQAATSATPPTMISSAVSLSAAGLAVAHNGPMIGMLIVMFGIGSAHLVDVRANPLAAVLSCAGLAAYLQITSITVH